MNKRTLRAVAWLIAMLSMSCNSTVIANGNVWADQPHGGYAPPGYAPQATGPMGYGMGFGMGMNMGFGGHGGMSQSAGPYYGAAPLSTYGSQSMPYPVSPEHPAWPSGYPGIVPGMSPAMTSGVP